MILSRVMMSVVSRRLPTHEHLLSLHDPRV